MSERAGSLEGGGREIPLRYGCNPHQRPAAAWVDARQPPFEILCGEPGYINLLDALNAWQLVREAEGAFGLPAAASFKHVSPAGAALGHPLDAGEARALGLEGWEFSAGVAAYARARGGDPLCSYGDFAAFSGVVESSLARLLKREVSDGIIAAGYTPAALELLRQKKGGRFIVLQGDPGYTPPPLEVREVFGVRLVQQRNDRPLTPALLERRVSAEQALSAQEAQDLLLAALTVKYTQSNSVACAWGGQAIGVGAGQQSRVDCTRLAVSKAASWQLRRHPRVLELPFRPEVRRVVRTNAIQGYLQGFATPQERRLWEALFTSVPAPLTEAQRREWCLGWRGVALASDAFFPFRDSLDQAALGGVRCIVQPGGSANDAEVIAACDEYGMVMAFSALRLFHH